MNKPEKTDNDIKILKGLMLEQDIPYLLQKKPFEFNNFTDRIFNENINKEVDLSFNNDRSRTVIAK